MATKVERTCQVVKANVNGDNLEVVVRIKGGLQNKTGDRVNWSAATDYPMAFNVPIEELVERFASERKIAMARLLRNTSVEFIEKLNSADVPWTQKQIEAMAAPYQIPEEDLDKEIKKLEAKMAALAAKKAARG